MPLILLLQPGGHGMTTIALVSSPNLDSKLSLSQVTARLVALTASAAGMGHMCLQGAMVASCSHLPLYST